MPRAKKDAGTAIDKRNGEKLTLLPTADEVEIPAPPRALLATSKEAWTRYWTDPVARIATRADHGLINRWIVAVDEHERALRLFRRNRIVEGSTGQPRINPLAAWIESRERTLKEAEDRLGLSPLARMRLGVAVGEALASLEAINAELMGADDDGDRDGDDDVVTIDGELV